MIKQVDTACMGILLVTLFILLVGPAALVWGTDSRKDESGWFGSRKH
jgi:hypothetical protein